MMRNSNNTEWLNLLRALATIGVIVIHVSSPVVNMTYGKDMAYWWIGNVFNSSVRFAVPVFLMISGATLLNKDYPLWEFYKKRLTRVFIPLAFWMIIYWVFRWSMLAPKIQPKSIDSIIEWGYTLFLKEGISKHFWYVYMMFFIYLFVPFIGKWIRKLNSKSTLYILTMWILACFVLRDTPLNLYNWQKEYLSKMLAYLLYTGYLVLGFYLTKIDYLSQKNRPYILLFFVITIFTCAFSTFNLSHKIGSLNLAFYSYLSINTIAQSALVFLFLKDSNIKNNFIHNTISTISNNSYGIYLAHIMVIGLFFKNGIFWTMAHPIISLPVVILLTLLTSFAINLIVCKIPYGKHITG